jgi:ABC-type glycerol-3-phosphate transport system substrate-binding protein
VITLTLWTTEAFSPTQVITSGRILAQIVTGFQESQPDVRLDFVLKKPYGKGGILDFLSTTHAAVPELLPDMVILDADELSAAVQAGLVQPLDNLLPADLLADLYPSARDASTFDGRLYGLQYQTDLDHLVYNSGRMALPPSSWPGVLSNPGPYIFPAGGRAGLVNDAFLIQYLAVKPWPFRGDPDSPFLEADALAAVLQYYQDGVSRGIVPLDVLDYHTTADSWREYLAGSAAMTQVSAHEYLGERDRSPSSAAAPIPAINGPAAGINRGWVLALVTAEAVRQSSAAAFMEQLMAPETNAAWNRATGYLPARQAALVYWDAGDSYTPFIHQQLQMAQPRPAIPNYARIGAALQQAVEDVLTGVATPEEAAAKAMESAQQ